MQSCDCDARPGEAAGKQHKRPEEHSNCRISLQRERQEEKKKEKKDDTQSAGERNKRRVVEPGTKCGQRHKKREILQAFNDIEFSGSPQCH